MKQIIPFFKIQRMPVIVDVHLEKGYLERAFLYVDNQLITSTNVSNSGSNTGQFIMPWTNDRIGNSSIYVLVEDNFGNLFKSNSYNVQVVQVDKELMNLELVLNPSVENIFTRDANLTRGSTIGARFILPMQMVNSLI